MPKGSHERGAFSVRLGPCLAFATWQVLLVNRAKRNKTKTTRKRGMEEDRVPHLHEQDRLDDQGHFRGTGGRHLQKEKSRARKRQSADYPSFGLCVFFLFKARTMASTRRLLVVEAVVLTEAGLDSQSSEGQKQV